MSEREQEPVDVLATMLRGGLPSAIDDRARDALLERAIDASSQARPQPTRRRSPVWALAVAAAVLLGLLSLPSAQAPWPSDLTLATGDRVHVVAGSDVAFERLDDRERRIALTTGAAVFDVASIEASVFEVTTPELSVVVRGTVFGVERVGERTFVRVYEGRVEVRDHGVVTQLARNESYASGAGIAPHADDGPLERLGRELAARRDAEPHVPAVAVIAPAPIQPQIVQPIVEAPAVQDISPTPRAMPRRAGVDVSDLEGWLAAGRFEDARARAHDERLLGRTGDAWRFGNVEARALQGLGRVDEAAALYDELVDEAPPDDRAALAFRAASARLDRLGDAHGALASLDRTSFDGTALQERALGLRARALDRAGESDAAARVAGEYLARYPEGGLAELMRALTRR